MQGELILVATPIGNLGDISSRAILALKKADFIVAEDTRVSLKLLNHLGIKKPMVSYHEHNKNAKGEIICKRILKGETCALITDAGMPAISDPGNELVCQCDEYGIKTSVIPGPSAVIAAVAISGLCEGRFTFEGFLSNNKKNRLKHFEQTINEERTMIFYEAPHKLLNTLQDMLKYYGDRKVAIIKELTKINEKIIRTTLKEAVNIFEDIKIKGEYVIVLEGAKIKIKKYTIEEAIKIAEDILEKGDTINETAKKVAQITKIKKSYIYNSLLKHKN